MFAEWFRDNIYSGNYTISFDHFDIYFIPYRIFGIVMFVLFLWASFHLITDMYMAFRAVFGFGYKKRKGGSH